MSTNLIRPYMDRSCLYIGLWSNTGKKRFSVRNPKFERSNRNGRRHALRPGARYIKDSSEVVRSVMRILLVEDDVKIASFAKKGLRAAGYAVDHAPDGETGLHLALNEPYDAAIVDIMLPKLDGLSLIKQMREKKINTPVIVLSAKDSVDDRVKGLQTGSDDYMTKPFAFSELLARVQALIRRAGGLSEPTQLVVRGRALNLP